MDVSIFQEKYPHVLVESKEYSVIKGSYMQLVNAEDILYQVVVAFQHRMFILHILLFFGGGGEGGEEGVGIYLGPLALNVRK